MMKSILVILAVVSMSASVAQADSARCQAKAEQAVKNLIELNGTGNGEGISAKLITSGPDDYSGTGTEYMFAVSVSETLYGVTAVDYPGPDGGCVVTSIAFAPSK